MARICGQCAYLELNNKERYSSKDRYWCKQGHGYRELTDTCPNNYDYTYNPVSKNIDKGGYTPSGCLITTMVCQILGYSDNCELLNILRDFRESFLKKDSTYFELLLEYDTYGPEISERLLKSRIRKLISLDIVDYFLIPCANLIKQNDFATAIEKYQKMFNFLINYFSVERKSLDINDENINMKTLGKARKRRKFTIA